jgi:putative CocE/NonD family hydrolase
MEKKRTLGILGLTLAGIGVYLFRKRLYGRVLGLQPLRNGVSVERGLQIPMPDGVNLAADHYAPRSSRLSPTILVRTPYGRGGEAGVVGLLSDFVAQRFAERGYNVVVQDVRGRGDSGGEFEPFIHEAGDGRATLDWLEQQAWFNGVLGMWGISYQGFAQWVIAPGAPLYLKALMPALSGTQIPNMARRDGALQTYTLLFWLATLDALEPGGWRRRLLGVKRMAPRVLDRLIAAAAGSLPLRDADRLLTGRTIPIFQEALQAPGEGPAAQYAAGLAGLAPHTTAAVHLVGGWYDILLRETLEDYQALRRVGRTPYLTLGPWQHLEQEAVWETLRQGLTWFDALLKGDGRHLRRLPVRYYLMGADEWLEAQAWPPPAQELRLFLGREAGGEGRLSPDQPGEQAPSEYTYDPSRPTPAAGGAMMSVRRAGPRDNRRLEKRPDVLTFTTPALTEDLDIAGPLRLVLYVRSSLEHTDFLGRLCDVSPGGRSVNLCEGLLRLAPGIGELQPGGARRIEIDLTPVANRFKQGHRLRLQVSSGAHPRWQRNPGTGEPAGEARELRSARQQVVHDPDHPSMLLLPVLRGRLS